jgi:hypothetical protein
MHVFGAFNLQSRFLAPLRVEGALTLRVKEGSSLPLIIIMDTSFDQD